MKNKFPDILVARYKKPDRSKAGGKYAPDDERQDIALPAAAHNEIDEHDRRRQDETCRPLRENG